MCYGDYRENKFIDINLRRNTSGISASETWKTKNILFVFSLNHTKIKIYFFLKKVSSSISHKKIPSLRLSLLIFVWFDEKTNNLFFCFSAQKNETFICTVGENIIATTQIRNNYPIINFSNIAIAILDFSLLLLVITLNPLCIIFCVSSLLLFWWLSL